MREIRIRKKKISDSDYIVYPVSYLNPLDNIILLEQELKEKIGISCSILMDLLLCNGNNFNRFVEFEFNGAHIDSHSIRIVTLKENDEKELNEYYKENKQLVCNGVLTPYEYMTYTK